MLGKGKQFKIERKKLVISKDSKPRQEEKQSKDYLKFQGRLVNQKRSSAQDKRDVQPLKQFRLRSSSRDIIVKIDQLVLQKKSTVDSSSKETEAKESQIQKNLQDFRMIWRNEVVQGLLKQLIQRMKDKQLSFRSQNHCYLIQKDYFVHMLEYMVCIFSSLDLVQCHRLFHKVSELKDILLSINRYCLNLKVQTKRTPLSLQSATCSIHINHRDYQSSLRERTSLLEYYNNSVTALEQRVKQLGQQIRVKEKQYEEVSQQTSHKQRQIDGLFLKISELEHRKGHLQQQIQAKSIKLEGVTTQIKKIQNYGCENRGIIKLVSQQYKEIQSNIYEYAVYLQSNELASHLGYQPHPFTQIQETLNNEYKELQTIKRDCSKISIQSLRNVWEVHERMIAFYRKKDQQMSKLGEFKTKCVIQFINHMKKWLNNWELKQEFLVNLRCQFAADTQAYQKCFENLNDVERENGEERTIGCLQELQSIYGRIEENYKLGNSFY